jgi:tetratricopeptide (TPR) repeat protein
MNTSTQDPSRTEIRLAQILDDYLAAIQRGAAFDRSALLAAHPDLAEDLKACLASLDFLRTASPADRLGSDLGEDGSASGLLGDFRILRELGRGGMGVVYEAHQNRLDRRVALKVVLAGRFAPADDLRRFRIEAEAAAQLDHPNIVPIYEVGEHAGLPYFSMKLLEGGSLADRLTTYRDNPRSAAALVATIARAIHHAHLRGILHRDLKPSNILLDEAGQPYVTDFGLAKRQGDGGDSTCTGAVLGSPPYMAPEQTSGKRAAITTATDVYGLGAVLYALLTGGPPFRADSAIETMEQVKTREPEPPRRLNPSVDRDLQAVCLKCLEKDPARRYASAEMLADDLERWQHGEPIEAIPPSAWYRARKFARRNRAALATMALISLVLIAGTAVSAWQAVRATNAERRATKQLSQIKEANAATTRALADSEEARTQAEAVSRFLVDAFQRPDPDQDGRELKVMGLLTSAAAKLDTEFTGSPKIKGDLLHALGRTLGNLNLPAEAVRIFQRALAIRRAALGPDHEDTLATQSSLGEAYLGAGRTAEALVIFQALRKIRESQLGPDHKDTLESQNNLAATWNQMGDPARAIPLLERTLEARKSILGPNHESTLATQNNLAAALSGAGRGTEAVALFRALVKVCEATLGPDHTKTLHSRNNLANALNRAGQFQEAIPLLQATLKVQGLRLGPDHPKTLVTRNNLAGAYWKAGRLDLSVPMFELVVRQSTAKLGPDHPDTLRAQGDLGVNLRDAGRTEDGLRHMEEALRRAQGRPELRAALGGIALQAAATYNARRQFNRSEPLYQEELAAARKSFGPNDPQTVARMSGLARNLLNQKKWSDAESVLRESLAVSEKTEPDSWFTFQNRWLLGMALVCQGKYANAEPLLVAGYEGMRAREATVSSGGPKGPIAAAKQLVQIYEKQGRWRDAASWRARLGLPDPDASMPNGVAAFTQLSKDGKERATP